MRRKCVLSRGSTGVAKLKHFGQRFWSWRMVGFLGGGVHWMFLTKTVGGFEVLYMAKPIWPLRDDIRR